MPDEKKKNVLDQIIDAVTDRDEKAAAEAVRLEAIQKAADQARANIAAQQAAVAEAKAKMEADARAEAEAKARADASAKAKAEADAKARAAAEVQARAAAEVQARAAAEERRQAELEKQEQLKAQQEARDAEAARIAAEKARAALPRHKVSQNDTLSDIALKHYGHATEPYWRLIYEANKEAIGPNPGVVRAGTELVIPVLPADLKK